MDWPEEFERYFVVGGDEESDPDEVLPFYGAEHRSRGETSRAYIGFRCALDAREANALRSAGGETGAGLRLVQP